MQLVGGCLSHAAHAQGDEGREPVDCLPGRPVRDFCATLYGKAAGTETKEQLCNFHLEPREDFLHKIRQRRRPETTLPFY